MAENNERQNDTPARMLARSATSLTRAMDETRAMMAESFAASILRTIGEADHEVRVTRRRWRVTRPRTD